MNLERKTKPLIVCNYHCLHNSTVFLHPLEIYIFKMILIICKLSSGYRQNYCQQFVVIVLCYIT